MSSTALKPTNVTEVLERDSGRTIYCLHYKSYKVEYEYFTADSQADAEEVGRKYCEVFKKRFIWVGPWLRDLKSVIEHKLKGD